jgi:membrane protease YdiL (CAAX protease family)
VIAAAIEIPEIVLVASGTVVLLAIARRSLRGRPLLPRPERPFRAASPGALLLAAAGLFLAYVVGGAVVATGELGIAGDALGIATQLAAAAAGLLFARRSVLEPRGTARWRIGMGLLHLWAALPVVLGAYLLCRLFGPEQRAVEQIRGRQEGWQGLVLLAVLVAPVAEEACFRGLVYPALRQTVSAPRAILLSSVAFALVHEPTTWLPLLVLAAVLAWLVETTGSVLPAIAAHMAFNALPVVRLLLSPPG